MQSVAMNMEIVRDPDARSQLGESPVWDPECGDLWWVDVDGCMLFRRKPGGEVHSWRLPEMPGFVVLTGPGHPAVGMETGIFAFTPETNGLDRMIAFERAGHRFNDACVDACGRLWTSTIALDAAPGLAEIHRVTDALTLDVIETGLSIPNGLAVDLSRGRLYFSDSHPGDQSVFTRALGPDGMIGQARNLFASTRPLDGRPDGAALDASGRYWIAGVDGAALYVFDVSGQLDAVVPLPFPCPTKLAFGPGPEPLIAITSKTAGADGGFLTLATPPAGFAGGTVQPYWDLSPSFRKSD